MLSMLSELMLPLNPAWQKYEPQKPGAWLSGVTDEMIQRAGSGSECDPGGYPSTGRTVRVRVKHRRSLCHWK